MKAESPWQFFLEIIKNEGDFAFLTTIGTFNVFFPANECMFIYCICNLYISFKGSNEQNLLQFIRFILFENCMRYIYFDSFSMISTLVFYIGIKTRISYSQIIFFNPISSIAKLSCLQNKICKKKFEFWDLYSLCRNKWMINNYFLETCKVSCILTCPNEFINVIRAVFIERHKFSRSSLKSGMTFSSIFFKWMT